MTESTPKRVAETAAWAIPRIATRMEQSPIPIHPRDGVDGHGFKVIDPEDPTDARTIGLFPDQHVVTINTPDVSIRIRNAAARPSQDGMEITAGDGSARALFLRDGHIAVEVFPIPALAVSEAALRDETPADAQIRDAVIGDDSGASSGEIRASEDATRSAFRARYESGIAASSGFDFAAASAELAAMDPDVAAMIEIDRVRAEIKAEISKGGVRSHADPPQEKGGTVPEPETNPNRVKNLRGRIATDPNMQPTPQGKPRVQFVLAEHVETDDDEHTVFHRVYTLNKQAESLQRRGLAKGQPIGVDGYRQIRTTKKKDGAEIHQEVIYANVVRTFGKRERAETDEARTEPK